MSTSPVTAEGARLPQVPSIAQRLRLGDRLTQWLTVACAATVVLLAAWLFEELFRNSALTRQKFGWSFFVTETWDPVAGTFGALPFVYGTVMTSLLALLISVPLGVGAAIFLAELAPAGISDFLTFLIELLAAVPSVIYGLLGAFIIIPFLKAAEPVVRSTLGFLPFFKGPFYGVSLLAAGVVLAIMIVPFIVSISREVLLAVPKDQREAALALGATRWETTWDIVVPFARAGISGSIFLALARALGETMAVTMVIGNVPKIAASLFAPSYTIAAVIANEFAEATDDLYRSALIELGLVLFILTFVINGLARLLIIATTKKGAA